MADETQSTLPQKQILEISKSLLNSDVDVWYPENETEYARIIVGNTGLAVVVEKVDGRPNIWTQHFMPEDDMFGSPDTRMKYSLIYAFALNKFLRWWKDENHFDQTNFPRQQFLFGQTNERFHRFRQRLLGGNIYKEIGLIEDDGVKNFKYSLDLSELARDQQVFHKIENLSQRCQREKYLMMNTVV